MSITSRVCPRPFPLNRKSTSHNPRSTVGTITEIYDYLRLLFARVGEPRCPDHGITLEAQTVSQMVDHVLALPEDSRLMLLAPVVEGRKGEHLQVFESLRSQGYVRARVDGEVVELDQVGELERRKKHSIEAVVDRFKVRADQGLRLAESFETALALGDGRARIVWMDDSGHDSGHAPWPRRAGVLIALCLLPSAVTVCRNSSRGSFHSTIPPVPAVLAMASV